MRAKEFMDEFTECKAKGMKAGTRVVVIDTASACGPNYLDVESMQFDPKENLLIIECGAVAVDLNEAP